MGNGRDVKLQLHLRWDVGSVVSSLSLQGEGDGERLGIFESSGESERLSERPSTASGETE